jgi:hypothetical protein
MISKLTSHPNKCAIPVFEGLLSSPHNEMVMTMLFRLAEWHALAKLRMHTDSTLTRMETVTSILGCELRKFANITCSAFSTFELPKEAAARGRKQAREQAKATASGMSKVSAGPVPGEPKKLKRRRKTLSLSTYKVHALGDYAYTIRMHGTTDSYSTQTVSAIPLCWAAWRLRLIHDRASVNIVGSNACMDAQTKILPLDR